jgi:hypothetical protein
MHDDVGETTYRPVLLHPTSLLGDTEEIEGLAPLKGCVLVHFILSQGRGARHEGFRCAHGSSIPSDERWREPGGDAEDAEQKEDADGPMPGLEPFRKLVLADKAELEIVVCEPVHGFDYLW